MNSTGVIGSSRGINVGERPQVETNPKFEMIKKVCLPVLKVLGLLLGAAISGAAFIFAFKSVLPLAGLILGPVAIGLTIGVIGAKILKIGKNIEASAAEKTNSKSNDNWNTLLLEIESNIDRLNDDVYFNELKSRPRFYGTVQDCVEEYRYQSRQVLGYLERKKVECSNLLKKRIEELEKQKDSEIKEVRDEVLKKEEEYNRLKENCQRAVETAMAGASHTTPEENQALLDDTLKAEADLDQAKRVCSARIIGIEANCKVEIEKYTKEVYQVSLNFAQQAFREGMDNYKGELVRVLNVLKVK